ncbi:50S ribosomal protein L30 [Candidatus Ornithobacterium hominis]|uniref:50S ribosomal protein L30 n=1 Tax=Candidatus Ornithobacterium hominis TaxID=2497989 RepID=UPI0024BC3564|nr:50S ribosomal protein L30 [Candidatus Ornithobacterium hominis]CAI9430018.1 50S ribosomal protein L30 [Candidatus Ornithobacterium hominis]
MAKIRIKQIKSSIKRPKNQKLVLESLGLKKINHEIEHENTPVIRGMINKVKHLIEISEDN